MPSVLTVFGIVTSVSSLQLLKAELPILVNESERISADAFSLSVIPAALADVTIAVNASQLANALAPILSTPAGSFTPFRLVQL